MIARAWSVQHSHLACENFSRRARRPQDELRKSCTSLCGPLSPRVSRHSAPHQRESGERVGVRGEPLGCTFPTIAHRVKLYQKIRQELAFFRASFFVQSDSAVQLRRAWEKHVQAARPSPHPLPARAQMGRATSCDTRGEGAPAVVLFNAAARCVHPLGRCPRLQGARICHSGMWRKCHGLNRSRRFNNSVTELLRPAFTRKSTKKLAKWRPVRASCGIGGTIGAALTVNASLR